MVGGKVGDVDLLRERVFIPAAWVFCLKWEAKSSVERVQSGGCGKDNGREW